MVPAIGLSDAIVVVEVWAVMVLHVHGLGMRWRWACVFLWRCGVLCLDVVRTTGEWNGSR